MGQALECALNFFSMGYITLINFNEAMKLFFTLHNSLFSLFSTTQYVYLFAFTLCCNNLAFDVGLAI